MAKVRVDLEREVNRVYRPLMDDASRYLILYGGAGSGKSVFAAQKIVYRMLTEPGHRFVCTRKVARTLRNSVFALLKQTVGNWGLSSEFKARLTDLTLSCSNRSEALCLGLDDSEKIKSIAGVSGFWHEEPTELSPQDLTQLNLRLRGETIGYKQHILSFNPISHTHWLKARFFDRRAANARIVKTTYRDNAFIDAEYAAELEALRAEDESLYGVYALGEWGVLKGLIYRPWPTLEAWPKAFDEEVRGLDFGFNHPTALVWIGLRDGCAHVREEVYAKHLTTRDLLERMEALKVSRRDPIYADPAEPDRIEEIRREGYNVHPGIKGPGSVNAGIVFCRSMAILSCPENEHLNRECAEYKWREDPDGNALDEPAKHNDHAMDAIRYALYTHLCRGRKQGIGSVDRRELGI